MIHGRRLSYYQLCNEKSSSFLDYLIFVTEKVSCWAENIIMFLPPVVKTTAISSPSPLTTGAETAWSWPDYLIQYE